MPEPPTVDAFAYYLPQFYPIPLNSAWWGEGYTEWNAVLNAQRGVRSPKGTTLTPGELGFYDLRVKATRRRQAELARLSGLSAFCVYHYFSKGERVLAEVVDAMLADGEPDFPFFLCWANHDWTLAWKGRPGVIIWRQEYDEDSNDSHIIWLLACFEDRRYFKIGNAPVLAVYRPELVPFSRETFSRWRNLARQAGHSGLVILGVAHSLEPQSPESRGLDGWIQGTKGALTAIPAWRRAIRGLRSPGSAWRLVRYQDYPVSAKTLSKSLESSRSAPGVQLVPMVVSSWNNVGRRPMRAWYLKADPENFARDLEIAMKATPIISSPDGARRLLAVNAWNEWGESMVIEPSVEYGDAMIKALHRGLHRGHVTQFSKG